MTDHGIDVHEELASAKVSADWLRCSAKWACLASPSRWACRWAEEGGFLVCIGLGI